MLPYERDYLISNYSANYTSHLIESKENNSR